MTKTHLVWREKTIGDTAVDGLLAGLLGGALMALLLVLAGRLTGVLPPATLAYFDPARTGNWLTGLLAHLAVSAIYGLVFALLLGVVGRLRPSAARRLWVWGLGYGLLLWLVGMGLVVTAVGAPLAQIPAWQFGPAHLVYGLASGLWLQKNQ